MAKTKFDRHPRFIWSGCNPVLGFEGTFAGKALRINIGGIAMAVPQQGVYLSALLAGFTALTAGFAGAGVLVTLVGLALLLYSAVSFYRIKSIESTK